MGAASKHATVPKGEPPKSVLTKCASSTYTDTCKGKGDPKAGYVDDARHADGRPRFEVHHIVCEISVAKRLLDYKKGTEDFIESCLRITPWDINNADNLVGLPRNRRFRVDWVQEPNEDLWTPVAWPSHQVDHLSADGYTHEVREWLLANVWDNLQATQDEDPHAAGAKQIHENLVNGQKEFLRRLKKCAKRANGVREGWKHRGEKGYEDWYEPFSMAQAPTPRNPGVVQGRGKNKIASGALTMIMNKLT